MYKASTVQSSERPLGLGKFIPAILLANTVLLVLGVMVLGDALVFELRPAFIPPQVWVLLDSPVHAALALLVVSPLFFRSAPTTRTFSRIAAAGAAAVFIDLDHFAAAGSFSVLKAITLPARPDTHSLAFALLCGLLAWALTRELIDGWLIFGVLASHVLRDASTGGTPLLWPLSFHQLSLPAYYASQIGLCLITQAVAVLWAGRAAAAPQGRKAAPALPASQPGRSG